MEVGVEVEENEKELGWSCFFYNIVEVSVAALLVNTATMIKINPHEFQIVSRRSYEHRGLTHVRVTLQSSITALEPGAAVLENPLDEAKVLAKRCGTGKCHGAFSVLRHWVLR